MMQALETISYDDDWLGPDWEATEALNLSDWDESWMVRLTIREERYEWDEAGIGRGE